MFRTKDWMMSHPYTVCYIAIIVTINFILSVVAAVVNH